MKIQKRFTLLLFIVALLPLITLVFFHHQTMHQLGEAIGTNTQQFLVQNEQEFLKKTVDDYTAILKKEKQILENAVRVQAREVERRLSRPAEPGPAGLFPEDFSKGQPAWSGMDLSYKHIRQTRQAGIPPVWVNYSHQVWFAPQGLERPAFNPDLRRLQDLVEGYRFVYRLLPEHIYWQQTTLHTGLQSNYPAHADFPPGYDPRQQPWFLETRQTKKTTWTVCREPVTRAWVQVVSEPFFYPDGSFAGATSMSTLFNTAFYSLKIPKLWAQRVQLMLARFEQSPDGAEDTLRVFMPQDTQYHGTLITRQSEGGSAFAPSETDPGFRGILKELASGESGVRKMTYRGREALFAFGSHEETELFPILILPYGPILDQTEKITTLVHDLTVRSLTFTGWIFIGASLIAFILAFFSARSITRPVKRLTAATNELAQGDFQTRVRINTGDELQELGDTVNGMGPMLLQNQRMRQALAVAEKSQQYLLPKESPRMKDFDISGISVYSDETGGDYYDFIDIGGRETPRLGIAIGDVSGHGIGAALLMASARGALRAYAFQSTQSLSDLFASLNRHLVRDTKEGQFLTLFFGILHEDQQSLSWVSAGHESALWLKKKEGRIQELPNTGMPLGITPEVHHPMAGPIVFEAGDIVLISTDGIRETRNPDKEMFGTERVEQLLLDHAHLETRELCRKIVSALEDFRQGAVQEDDVTMVLIKYTPTITGFPAPP